MPEIICAECNATVPGTSEYCPECGYPFDIKTPELNPPTAHEPGSSHIQPTVPFSPDTIVESLASVKQEMSDLQRAVTGIRQFLESRPDKTTDTIETSLAAISAKLESLETCFNRKTVEGESAQSGKTKKELLAAFYKTLNSPNSMFEYMFYICIAQTIFIVVNLFVTAYVVTLVR